MITIPNVKELDNERINSQKSGKFLLVSRELPSPLVLHGWIYTAASSRGSIHIIACFLFKLYLLLPRHRVPQKVFFFFKLPIWMVYCRENEHFVGGGANLTVNNLKIKKWTEMKKGRKKTKKNKATKKLYQLSICKGGGHFVPFFSLFYLFKINIFFFIY